MDGLIGLEIKMLTSAVLAAAAPGADHHDVFKGLPAMIDGNSKTYGQVKLSVKQQKLWAPGLWLAQFN